MGGHVEADRGLNLRADCSRCFGLCCVAPAFVASADFAITKHAGEACPNLQADFRCSIHDRLRPRGFPGCAVYDCFGAGQRVAQETFAGKDWRRNPGTATQMFDAFSVMRQLHELLWHLREALRLAAARPIHDQLRRAFDSTEHLTEGGPAELAAIDLPTHRREMQALLVQASELVRAQVPRRADRRGADLTRKRLRGADLRGTNLAGALLIAADLRGADLTLADVAGADLRAADVRGANLGGAIFLTQSQVDAARGDRATTLPSSLARPARWR
jgi:uncharacterized protein YjbI with pentapeptide repeats